MYSFPNLEPVHCPMLSSNCCFLTCIQVYQEAGKVIWYSDLFQNLPQFVVIHTVKGFSVVNEAEADVFSGILLLFLWSNGFGKLISSNLSPPQSWFQLLSKHRWDIHPISSFNPISLARHSPPFSTVSASKTHIFQTLFNIGNIMMSVICL